MSPSDRSAIQINPESYLGFNINWSYSRRQLIVLSGHFQYWPIGGKHNEKCIVLLGFIKCEVLGFCEVPESNPDCCISKIELNLELNSWWSCCCCCCCCYTHVAEAKLTLLASSWSISLRDVVAPVSPLNSGTNERTRALLSAVLVCAALHLSASSPSSSLFREALWFGTAFDTVQLVVISHCKSVSTLRFHLMWFEHQLCFYRETFAVLRLFSLLLCAQLLEFQSSM